MTTRTSIILSVPTQGTFRSGDFREPEGKVHIQGAPAEARPDCGAERPARRLRGPLPCVAALW